MSKKILWFVPGATAPGLKDLARANGLTIRNPQAFSEGASLEDCDAVTGMVPKAYADKFKVIDEPEGCSWQDASLLQDGPTVGEYVEAGYPASTYPPKGYASRSTQDEVAAAIAAQAPSEDKALKVDELREALTAKGILFDPKALKPELKKLLDDAVAIEAIKAKLTEKGTQFAPEASLEDLQKLLGEAA
ncbi:MULTISPECIES: hypothetical protein [Pseudomonas putida group]|uniref:hypothetical protein n=1 Tax=Pseudomonas putida group TaxID=136845 RepID=UPI00067B24A1|nr:MULTISPECIES: hypothetical protein [Pseudomonas putida group]